MIGDYEDDTHFCLKCHNTIIGLDNYVTHRKTQCGKNIELPKSPLPSQLLPPDDSFNLKADDFFSSLELQSSSKKIPQAANPGKNFTGILTRSKTTAVIQATATNKEDIPQSKSGKNVWIGGHQLKLGTGDNQSRLIKAVDNLERRKIEPPKLEVFEESDVESDEFDYDYDTSDEDNNAPPRNHTGGKWKPSSPVQDWNAPPPIHTGGKWKPQARRNSPPPTHTKGKWKPSFDFPPPTFTGSKWTQSKAKEYEETKKIKPKPSAPSPTYTKGKWIPQEPKKTKISDDSPLRKSSGMVQYWCRPCNRRLASKIVYERHLKSELHFKRTLHDREFDEQFGLDARNKKKTVQAAATSTITKTIVKKRNRKKLFVRCEVCKSRVRTNSMGKHLISHYHCRKGDITTPESNKLVLDYIFDIILQSPYQCSMCKFYFNYQTDFLQHWLSSHHKSKTNSCPGYFWCSLCKFKNGSNVLMYYHLISLEHKEVVAVINRSVPIVIKRVNPLRCEECQEEFLLNMALAKHCNQTGHQSENLLANVNNIKCESCDQVFRSNIQLTRHKKHSHGLPTFICTPCHKTFESREEAKQHRDSKEHRYKLEGNNKERKCDYCPKKFNNVPELKDHLKEAHTEFLPKCLRCGMSFVLPQELTVHLRTNSCSYNETDSENRCDKCPFSSTSTSELLFHKVLHTEPVSKGVKERLYKCPLCVELFPKSSLLAHLRMHTKERPFVCAVCKKGFVRKNNWLFHMRNIHEKNDKLTRKKDKEESFLCSTCGASFHRKAILQQHMITHSGKTHKCPKSGCIFYARTMSELKQHFVTHSDVKTYACSQCDYRGKTSQQLKRHSTIHSGDKKYVCDQCNFSARSMSHLKRHKRLHTGAKPYNCPHCSYKCNTLENLRKHILSTNKHRGKCIYECKFCQPLDSSFQSNFAKEFKAHLITQHLGLFKTGREAASYIAGIYDVQAEDCTEVPTPYSSGNEEQEDESLKTTSPKIIILQESNDPIVTPSTSKDEEIFPMFIIPKEVDALNETWNVVGSYDVEESGNLVPFNTDNVLLQNHF